MAVQRFKTGFSKRQRWNLNALRAEGGVDTSPLPWCSQGSKQQILRIYEDTAGILFFCPTAGVGKLWLSGSKLTLHPSLHTQLYETVGITSYMLSMTVSYYCGCYKGCIDLQSKIFII